MAAVSENLFQLIAKQVDDKGLVVWYDPKQAYVGKFHGGKFHGDATRFQGDPTRKTTELAEKMTTGSNKGKMFSGS